MHRQKILENTRLKMDSTLKVLDNEFKGLRTGRASVNFLDPVVVEAYGDKMHLSQVASVTTPDARTISVQVWDKALVKTVEKAIADANLGVTTSSEGDSVRISIPPLSEDRRKDMVKLAAKYGENTKIALRNVRRDSNEELKKLEKDKQISKDEHHSISEEVQKITNEYSDKIDKKVKDKEKEILNI